MLSSFAWAVGLFTGCTHVQPETQHHTFRHRHQRFSAGMDSGFKSVAARSIPRACPKNTGATACGWPKAMGLNTVCAYLFWNLHEPRPGEFNWTGQADVATFCRIAQQEGLWVILRPGPYSCAEWEMGGTPWWLLKYDDIQLRTRDPHYLDAAKKYLNEVGRVLGPLQITHGGNIIMVQVENEYGFFGKDTAYVNALRQAILNAGFDVPLFQCNPPDKMKNGLLPGMFQAGNFGSDVVKNFEKVRKLQPSGPLICLRILSRLVRHLGSAASPRQTGRLSAEPENDAPQNPKTP